MINSRTLKLLELAKGSNEVNETIENCVELIKSSESKETHDNKTTEENLQVATSSYVTNQFNEQCSSELNASNSLQSQNANAYELEDDTILLKTGTFFIDDHGDLIEIAENCNGNEESQVFENVPEMTLQLSPLYQDLEKNNSDEVIDVTSKTHDENIKLPTQNDAGNSSLNMNEGANGFETAVNVLSNITIGNIEEENNYSNNTKASEKNLEEGSQEVCKRKRRKRHQVDENEWACNKAKILREQGKEYIGRKIINGKLTELVKRPKRKMKEINCKCTGKTFRCSSLLESERKLMFDDFWKLSWDQRKTFLKSMTEVNLTQRSRDRKIETTSRRNFSFKFYLSLSNSKVRVCKKTLLATLGIGEWMLNRCVQVKENEDVLSEDEINGENSKEDNERAGKKAKRKVPTRQEDLCNRLSLLKTFLLAMPKVESHYCRSSSTKLYLESNWTTKSQLYQFYSDNWCKEKNCKPLSSCTFYKTFEDMNLSLYRPKKDLCDLCRAYTLKHISDEEYNEHLKKKTAARQEKDKDKVNEACVYTVDLQSLLLCPKSNASALYYRRKLSVHNLCFYDLKTHDGFCYLWNESEGELTANEFASIMYHFIESQLPLRNNAKKIVIYSDGCNYQNRSSILSNALLHISVKYDVVIESKYLEKGHTQMECDSMHSVIERHLKQREINVPADYVEVCRNARKSPRPYKVIYLDHSFFKNYSTPMMFKSIRPGLRKGDNKVTDIRCLKYSGGKIYYKVNFDEEFRLLPSCGEKGKKSVEILRKSKRRPELELSNSTMNRITEFGKVDFPQLHNNRIKITYAKYKHLQELKTVIAGDYHSFYDQLPFEEK